MAYNDFIPMYIKTTENKRPREVVTSDEWNNKFNLLVSQGDHNSEAIYELITELFSAGTGSFNIAIDDIEMLKQTKLDTTIADNTFETIANAVLHIVGVTFNEQTGEFTFERENGTTFTINTALEKVATNWEYDQDTQSLVLTLVDGTTQTVSLSDFITPTEFVDSADIVWAISGPNVSAAISPTYMAGLVDITNQAIAAQSAAELARDTAATSAAAAQVSEANALISEDNAKNYMISASNYEANVKNAAAAAALSETNAEASAIRAKSYAVGLTASRPNEDIDNAKYYSEQAKLYANQAAASQIQTDWNQTDPTKITYIRNKPDTDQMQRDISTNTIAIAGLSTDVANNAAVIAASATLLGEHTSAIAQNTADILTNSADIAQNTADIADLKNGAAKSGTDLTYAEYEALSDDEKANGDYYITDYPDEFADAENIPASVSGLTATNVKDALEELVNKTSDSPIMRSTLSAGDTEITFANADITADTAFDFYTSVYGLNPTEVNVEVGVSITLTFEAQDSDVEVGVRFNG